MTLQDYQASVAAFSRELTGLFQSTQDATRTGPVSFAPGAADDLESRADRLADASAGLIQQSAAYLDDPDMAIRLGAEQHLLAQATAAVRVAELLLSAAGDGEMEEPPAAAVGLEPEALEMEEVLAILELPLSEAGWSASMAPVATRAAPMATVAEVIAASNRTIDTVLDGVVDFTQDSIAGLVGLDVALLEEAASMIGSELADLVNKLGEQASRLIAKAIGFIIQAYDSLLAALGQEATSELRAQAAAWLQYLQEGQVMAQGLETIYELPKARKQLQAILEASTAAPTVLGQARVLVEELPLSFQGRTKLVRQLLAALGLLKRIPAARLPMVELGSAVVYVALLGFTVYIGADYVDSPRLQRLDRIPGVVRVVEAELTAG